MQKLLIPAAFATVLLLAAAPSEAPAQVVTYGVPTSSFSPYSGGYFQPQYQPYSQSYGQAYYQPYSGGSVTLGGGGLSLNFGTTPYYGGSYGSYYGNSRYYGNQRYYGNPGWSSGYRGYAAPGYSGGYRGGYRR